MNIAIIGVGNVGGNVARNAVRAGHDVTLAASNKAHARPLADELGATAAEVADAINGADVVVLAVPHIALADLVTPLKDSFTGKIVVDATNPLKADYSGLSTTDHSAAEDLQSLLPDSHVVKALNTVFAANHAEPVVDGAALDGFYAGDDAAAKQTVRELLTSLGYRPVDAGPLAYAHALEQMAWLNISLNIANEWSWQSGWKLVGPTG